MWKKENCIQTWFFVTVYLVLNYELMDTIEKYIFYMLVHCNTNWDDNTLCNQLETYNANSSKLWFKLFPIFRREIYLLHFISQQKSLFIKCLLLHHISFKYFIMINLNRIVTLSLIHCKILLKIIWQIMLYSQYFIA